MDQAEARAWRMVRRLGLRLDVVNEPGLCRLRLSAPMAEAAIEVHALDAEAAVRALAGAMERMLAHPHPQPVGRRGENFAGINAERIARTTCERGHPYSIIGKQRRCKVCAAEYRRHYRARKRQEKT